MHSNYASVIIISKILHLFMNWKLTWLQTTLNSPWDQIQLQLDTSTERWNGHMTTDRCH